MEVRPVKIGRNAPCPCGKLKPNGEPRKYKSCCLERNQREKRQVVEMSITREDFISGPYKTCPSCSGQRFGVQIIVGGSDGYTRECLTCGFQKGYSLPKITKRIVYLDQFVISNLIKLLDKDHKSHEAIKKDPFWSELFIKLERASKLQAIVCPDSFYHREESLIGGIDFRLMKRLYEHFSSGKTLSSAYDIERMQVYEHFRSWLKGKKHVFSFARKQVCQEDLDTWSLGIRVAVDLKPYPGEVDELMHSNTNRKDTLATIWSRWQAETNFGFVQRVKEETLAFGTALVDQARASYERNERIRTKIAAGESHTWDLNDLAPPLLNGVVEGMQLAARQEGIPEDQIYQHIGKYFADFDALIQVPKLRISSVMFAGLARQAQLGKREPPHSFTDVQFISSYLPYCDALFVDIESRVLLKELPQNTPPHLRLEEFPAKVFSLRQKEQFLNYLDDVISSIPPEQMTALRDAEGDDHGKPYWEIIENEKRELRRKATEI